MRWGGLVAGRTWRLGAGCVVVEEGVREVLVGVVVEGSRVAGVLRQVRMR